MNTRRMVARRFEEIRVDEEVPLQVEKVEQVAQIPPQGVQVPSGGQGNEVRVILQK